MKDIERGKYTHVLMSTELAVSDKLRKTVLEPKFKNKFASVVIDEAYLVEVWSIKFKPDYARLRLLRSFLSRSIPW